MLFPIFIVWAVVCMSLMTDENENHLYLGAGLFALGMILLAYILRPSRRDIE